jgi:hypothetical protein
MYWAYNNDYASLVSTGYGRFDWTDIEPREGEYNWALIDYNINLFASRGKKFAFGVMCANTSRPSYASDGGKYVTPAWVFNAGAKGRDTMTQNWETGVKSLQVIPIWSDSVFNTKLAKFVQALGNRYDGNQSIAFIDIRSYGNWGEQHLTDIGGIPLSANEVRQFHLKPYKNAFPKTRLIIPWGQTAYNPIYDWAVNNGFGIRRDGIFKFSDGSECARAYAIQPAVFEFTAGYPWLVSSGYWNSDSLIRFIEKGKPSYVQFDEKMYLDNTQLLRKLGNRIGFHFVVNRVVLPVTIRKGTSYSIETEIINKGVSPLLDEGHLALGVFDQNGKLIDIQWLSAANPAGWQPGQAIIEKHAVRFSTFPAGRYKFALGLFEHEWHANPTYRFANVSDLPGNWLSIAAVNAVE